ncbi:MAG TPA: sulfite reductase subunit beta, partial [Chitinophagaceae bacterium]|nr:sulfite reductase subunit beta [Chitinophagaceae bacterium]
RREERAEKKLERLYSFMIRLRLPGGLLTSQQWLALHEVTDAHTTGVIKITTRQTVQLHGILKSHIKPTIAAFDKVKLDSIAACGDVNRNVTVSAHQKYSPVYDEIFSYADSISSLMLPKTRAYYEIWLDEEKLAEYDETDPLYEDRYLPRKFKIAIAIPPFNDVDVFTNDIGLIAIVEKDKLIGFNVAAGGGLGTTHGNADTYPRIGSVLGYVAKDDVLKVVYEIATTQRDYGNRSDRKLSRLKYTMDKMGVENFKQEVEKRSGIGFQKAKKAEFKYRHDEYGWHKNHEGLWYYTAFVESGRILDDDNAQLKTIHYKIRIQEYESTVSSKLIYNENFYLSKRM